MRTNARDSKGFTLIEVTMVVVILGVLSAYALPRWSPADTTVAAQAHRLARDLRHAQEMAMSQGRTLSFDIQAPSDYRVVDTVTGVTINDPATQQNFQITLDENVTVAGTDTDFDSLGRPLSGGVLLAVPRVFTLSGASKTSTVTMSAVTGFVSVTP